MHIINLQAENFKKLIAVDITPTDAVVNITGANAAGKSSVLDAITAALCGGREIPAEPLRKGSDKGKIVMDLGDYIVTRSFVKDNTYLKIESKDGSKITSPQKFLDDIVGNVSFDPLDFMNHDKKRQRDVLLDLVGIKTDDLDRQEKDLREQRTLTGRDRDKAVAVLKSLSFDPQAPKAEVDVQALIAERDEAVSHNQKIAADTQANEDLRTAALAKRDEIKNWEAQIAELQAKIDAANEFLSDAKQTYLAKKAELDAMEAIDVQPIAARINNVSATNDAVRANKRYLEAKKDASDLEQEYAGLTADIEAVIKQRTDSLTSAQMPIDGLTFDSDGLYYNDIPLDQCSDGEKLMVSLAISMALNPKLRVLRIKDGSLLDARNRAIIAETVRDRGYQLWYESVGTDSKVGIMIEAGEVRAIDGEPVEPKKRERKAKEDSHANQENHNTAPVSAKPHPLDDTSDW